MFFDILQTEEVKHFFKNIFFTFPVGAGATNSLNITLKCSDEMCCTCVGRGACSSHMKPCAARSPFSIQSWSIKRAWLGNSGHSSMRQDKVRRAHTLEHTPARCGWCVIVIVNVYLSSSTFPHACSILRSHLLLQQILTKYSKFSQVTSAVFMSSGFHSCLQVPYVWRRRKN